MKPFRLPFNILCVFLVSCAYWIYLAYATSMSISCDALGYQTLGQWLKNHGFIAYLKTGPNREPMYPLLVALSMQWEILLGISYTKIMAFIGIGVLFFTQIMLYWILSLLNIRSMICALTLLYFCISPSLNNTALSLYSEIATYPFILGIVLLSYQISVSLNRNQTFLSLSLSSLLGFLLALMTLNKAVFECIAPFYLASFFLICYSFTPKKLKTLTVMLCFLLSLAFFCGPVSAYKGLNKKFNGNFVVTNRGSWALYGNTVRRVEAKTFKEILTALAYVPGEGVCRQFFTQNECEFWSFLKSDELGYGKIKELNRQNISGQEADNILIRASLKMAVDHLPQYSLLTFLEAMKLFFWESTQIGFVDYPSWLERIYNLGIFKNGLRLSMTILTFITFAGSWYYALRNKDCFMSCLLCLIAFYLFFYSFFFIINRYALPIAPLFLICMAYSTHHFLSIRK